MHWEYTVQHVIKHCSQQITTIMILLNIIRDN